MKESAVAGVVVLSVVAGLVVFAAIVAYAMLNDSGHTAVNPYLALWVFTPVLGAGCVAVCQRRRLAVRLGILAIGAGCAGVALLVFLDQSNTLLQYEVWISRGMP